MLSRKYKTVVAGILTAAALFSPLLCGMTYPEARAQKSSAAAEVAPTAGEFVASGVVGCLLTRVVLNAELSDWADVLNVGNWVWVGVGAVELVSAIERGLRG